MEEYTRPQFVVGVVTEFAPEIGRITITPDPGQGFTGTVTLPLRKMRRVTRQRGTDNFITDERQSLQNLPPVVVGTTRAIFKTYPNTDGRTRDRIEKWGLILEELSNTPASDELDLRRYLNGEVRVVPFPNPDNSGTEGDLDDFSIEDGILRIVLRNPRQPYAARFTSQGGTAEMSYNLADARVDPRITDPKRLALRLVTGGSIWRIIFVEPQRR